MKHIHKLIVIVALMLCGVSCKGFLDLQPTDSVSADALFASEGGINAFLSNLYYQLPIEDFTFEPNVGFHFYNNNSARYLFKFTEEAVGSQTHANFASSDEYTWWVNGYKFNKDINLFFSYIPNLTGISEETRDELYGQAWFCRAWTYFKLAQLYGGVPIIEEVGDIDDPESLMVPRSTEVETWKYVIDCCDKAISYLGDGDAERRKASKWTALGLKSRAAIHAASLAKYWDRSPFSGEAVDLKYVGGFTENDAKYFYGECISACEEIIKNGPFTLYKPDPASPKEAESNLVEMFQKPNTALCEILMIKGYNEIGEKGHSYNLWGAPNQCRDSWPHPGRNNPTLEMVDKFEYYDRPGEDGIVITTTDGVVGNYAGYDATKDYAHYSTSNGIFEGKDARFWAYLIAPSTEYKGKEIICQGGIIDPSGKDNVYPAQNLSYSVEDAVTGESKTYYAYGAPSAAYFSGYFNDGSGNFSRTGFFVRKYLDPDLMLTTPYGLDTQDWIEMRLPEIMTTYAEAVVESGLGDEQLAKDCINAIRHRAGHTTDVELTLANVERERMVELCFENKRYWDLVRRREIHSMFNPHIRKAICPIFDCRTEDFIFVRTDIVAAIKEPAQLFKPMYYYKSIPGVASNGLVNNPQR